MRTPGGVVRLEAIRVGGRWLMSRGAVARFVAALTAASSPTHTSNDPPVRTPAQRQRAAERAAEELKRRGA